MTKNSPNLDIALLRTFVAGANAGNFSKVADQVGRTQSAISLQLRRLEEQAGCKLLEKRGRNLALNSMGEMLYRYAQRILDLNDEAVAAVRFQDVAGEVRLGIPPDIAETWLPNILARLTRIHPDVVIEARVDRNRTLLDDLATNTLDIAIVWNGDNASQSDGAGVADMPVSWIGSPQTSFNAAAPLPLVLMGAPCLFRQRALDSLDAAGRTWRVAFTSTSLAGVWAAVEAGLGVTVRTSVGKPEHLHVLPDRLLAQHGIPKKLGTISLQSHLTTLTSKNTRRFFDMLIELLAQELRTANTAI